MTEYIISLNSPWFELVRSGQKQYEGRRYSGNVMKYQVGDRLRIQKWGDSKEPSYTAEITAIFRFQTFEQALVQLPLNEVLPGITSIAEGIEVYKRYVSLPTQLKDGVCMIQLSPA